MRAGPKDLAAAPDESRVARVAGAAIEGVLAFLLCFAPAAFGTIHPWSEAIVVAAAAVVAALLVVRHAGRSGPGPVGSWTFVPILFFLLWSAAQLVPLPADWVRLVSPETVAYKVHLLADLPEVAAAVGRRTTLSFYPAATRHDLAVVLVATTVFVAVVDLARDAARARRLLTVATVVGGGFTLLALAQYASGADKTYWAYPAVQNRPHGPFGAYSNYAQYANLATGAALGLLFANLAADHRRPEVDDLDDRAGWRAVPWANAALVGLVAVGALTVFLSRSRGGMVAAVAAAGFTTAAVARSRQVRGRGWVMVLVVAAAFVGLLLVGGFDAALDRLATIAGAGATNGRDQITRSILEIVRRFPVAGVGLGAHRFVYPAFDRTGAPVRYVYADGDYAQMAEEVGLVGLGLVVVFVGSVWACYARAVGGGGRGDGGGAAGRPAVCAAAFGLGYGLLASVVHGASDFGQHLPGVACLTAVSCGLIVALAGHARTAATAAPAGTKPPTPSAAPPRPAAGWRGHLAGLTVPLSLLAATGWAAADAHRAWRAATDWERGQVAARDLAARGWRGADADYAGVLAPAAAAAERFPDNVEYRYWLGWYRWRAISRGVDAAAGPLVLDDAARAATRRVVADLHAARALCPTYGPLLTVAGQLELFALGDPGGDAHAQAGAVLSPGHPTAQMAAALTAGAAGDFDRSFARAEQALALDPGRLGDAIDLYAGRLGRPLVAVRLAFGRPDRLLAVTDRLQQLGLGKDDVIRAALAAEAEGIKADGLPAGAPAADWAQRADFFLRFGDRPAAVDAYRRAVESDYGQGDWHLRLAALYADLGLYPDAVAAARIAKRFRPNSPEANRLIQAYAGRPASAPAGR